MTSTRSNGVNQLLYLFVPIQLMAVYGQLSAKMEFLLLFVYNAISIMAHLHYAICVVGWRIRSTWRWWLTNDALRRFVKSVIIWTSWPLKSLIVRNQLLQLKFILNIDEQLRSECRILFTLDVCVDVRCSPYYVDLSQLHLITLALHQSTIS